MKVLVTGGSGAMGGYITRELLRGGHHVWSYSRTAPLVEGVTFTQGDIMDLRRLTETCQGYDAIVHLAVVGLGRVRPEELMSLNVMGTAHVLEAAVRAGVGKVVFASSNAVLGFTYQKRPMVPHYFPIDEEHPCEPQDGYGLSKLLGEVMCKSYSDAHGMQTICLRINTNWYVDRKGAEVAVRSGWGKGMTVDELWTTRYLRAIEASGSEQEWPVPGPPCPWKNLWAVTDARDGAQAFRLALENNDITHEVFLINGDDTCSTVETRQLLARFYPQVLLKVPLEGHASLWSHQKATRMLGYRPQFTWRKSDFQLWMQERRKSMGASPTTAQA